MNKRKDMSNNLVSVVITTKDEGEVLENLLISLKWQNYKNIEILLVDNNSSDNTKEIAGRFDIRVYNHGPERSTQRNFAAKRAKGKYLLFLDADMKLRRDVVGRCIKALEKQNEWGAVTIPEDSEYENFWEKVKAFERSFYNQNGDEITDAARFFRKSVFIETGGYDEDITGPEDWDLTDRIRGNSYKIGRIASVIYHKERISSLSDLAKKKFYYALSLHKFLHKQKKGIISPRTVYFLRPVFYRNLNKFFSNPILSLALFLMLSVELISGAAGYMIGRIKR